MKHVCERFATKVDGSPDDPVSNLAILDADSGDEYVFPMTKDTRRKLADWLAGKEPSHIEVAPASSASAFKGIRGSGR